MHSKTTVAIPVGGQAVCGSRKLRLDAVNGNVADVTLTLKVGETVEVRDPMQRDNPWIIADLGEGDMVERAETVTIGHKVRVGNFRQFRIVEWDGTNATVVIVGPE